MENEIVFDNSTPAEESKEFINMMESNYTSLDVKSTPFHAKISQIEAKQ
jgi:hypothetical protein